MRRKRGRERERERERKKGRGSKLTMLHYLGLSQKVLQFTSVQAWLKKRQRDNEDLELRKNERKEGREGEKRRGEGEKRAKTLDHLLTGSADVYQTEGEQYELKYTEYRMRN